MKNRILIILSIVTILILFVKCRIMDSCPPPSAYDIENDSNAIDWENYNDVKTVFVNNHLECSDVRVKQNNGKSIKIYGWLTMNGNKITIKYMSLLEERFVWAEGIPIYTTSEIQEFIATCDLTQKCYIKGELKLEKVQDGKGVWCCIMMPFIILNNINDIYFEEKGGNNNEE